MMRVLLLAPDGVGVRNFLLEPCGTVIRRGAEVRVLTGFPSDLVPEEWRDVTEEMPVYREGALGMLLRYALANAHSWGWDTRAMRFVRRMPLRGQWRVKVMYVAARPMPRPKRWRHIQRLL